MNDGLVFEGDGAPTVPAVLSGDGHKAAGGGRKKGHFRVANCFFLAFFLKPKPG
jgi:hypothetical protein